MRRRWCLDDSLTICGYSTRVNTLSFGGSTAMAPLISAAAGEVSKDTDFPKIALHLTGSRAGVDAFVSGDADAAFADDPLLMPPGMASVYPVAAFAIAFIAHPSACIQDISAAELRALLAGEIRNWAQAGGADVPVRLITRDTMSGIRFIVEHRVLGERRLFASDQIATSNRSAAIKVQQTPGALSFVSLPAARDLDVVQLGIDGRRPTNASVLQGVYPYWSCGQVFVRSASREHVLRMVDYVTKEAPLCDYFGFIALNRKTVRPERTRG